MHFFSSVIMAHGKIRCFEAQTLDMISLYLNEAVPIILTVNPMSKSLILLFFSNSGLRRCNESNPSIRGKDYIKIASERKKRRK